MNINIWTWKNESSSSPVSWVSIYYVLNSLKITFMKNIFASIFRVFVCYVLSATSCCRNLHILFRRIYWIILDKDFQQRYQYIRNANQLQMQFSLCVCFCLVFYFFYFSLSCQNRVLSWCQFCMCARLVLPSKNWCWIVSIYTKICCYFWQNNTFALARVLVFIHLIQLILFVCVCVSLHVFLFFFPRWNL